jgi:hypothetical protein
LDEDWNFEDNEAAENTIKELRAYVDSGLEALRDQVKALEASRATVTGLLALQRKDAMAKQHLAVSTELSSPEAYYYEFKNADGERLAGLSISKEEATVILKLDEPVGDYEASMELGDGADVKLAEALSNGVEDAVKL